MRKVDDREKKKEKKIMLFLVATNVVASRPPERRLTGTPQARDKRSYILTNIEIKVVRGNEEVISISFIYVVCVCMV